jgi:hypothetical protein
VNTENRISEENPLRDGERDKDYQYRRFAHRAVSGLSHFRLNTANLRRLCSQAEPFSLASTKGRKAELAENVGQVPHFLVLDCKRSRT